MATYLYGLLLAGERPREAARAGIGDADVRVLECGELACLASTVSDRVKPTLATVRAHDAALQHFVDAGHTVAAVRFGQQFGSDEDCRAHVQERSGRIAEVLRSHPGTVEMRVLLPVEESQESPPAPRASESRRGTAYLEALRARSRAVPDVHLVDAIGPIVLAEKVEALPRSHGYSFAHLVRRTDVSEYREAIAALPALGDARVVGPLALYSFAEAD